MLDDIKIQLNNENLDDLIKIDAKAFAALASIY